MATATTRSRFYYPLLGLGAALLVVSVLLELVSGATRPALYVFVVSAVVVLGANVREWRHQRGRPSA